MTPDPNMKLELNGDPMRELAAKGPALRELSVLEQKRVACAVIANDLNVLISRMAGLGMTPKAMRKERREKLLAEMSILIVAHNQVAAQHNAMAEEDEKSTPIVGAAIAPRHPRIPMIKVKPREKSAEEMNDEMQAELAEEARQKAETDTL